jgi:natural product biosynthesis luciferase-like monooxygenase protein
MSSYPSFNCYLIGADSLLMECAEALLAKGHQILGVVTSAPRILQWAQERSLSVISDDTNYAMALREIPFDFLFSITHLAIIREDVLALPRKMAINFHDGPLPAYAGLNAPAWALLHRAVEYGITWHQITSCVDRGPILKQARFEIAKDETSVSLNTKCFAAALESFPQLVDELAYDRVTTQAQDSSQRSYFGKFQRPPAAGVLQWQKPADELEAFVRAMDFGEYRNPLVSPKVFFENQVFSVATAFARDEEVDLPVGQVLDVDEGQINVATGSGVLSITKLRDIGGKSLSPGQFANQFGLTTGKSFQAFSAETLTKLTEIDEVFARNDEYWMKQLAELVPMELPLGNSDSKGTKKPEEWHRVTIALPMQAPRAIVVTAFALLLARFARKQHFDLAYANLRMQEVSQVLPGVYHESSVLHFEFARGQTAMQAVAEVESRLCKTDSRGSWTNDLMMRSPEWSSNPELAEGTALPVAISVGTNQPVAGSVMTLVLSEDNQSVQLVFDKQRLTVSNANRLGVYLTTYIANIQASPDTLISELELLTESEKRQLLEEWNETRFPYDAGQCIHELFEQRVALNPNGIALVFENQTLTYQELNQRANQVAQRLIELGIVADDLVGVYVQRSPDLMVATLGILKAGAAYVPLDPAFPSERIAYMVQDARMRVVLTQESIRSALPPSSAEIVCVDGFEPSSFPLNNPQVDLDATKLAYVIYTSGSTGNPKGVMVEHRNVTSFFVGMDARIEHDPPGTWLAVTSLSFDISVLELFWTLTRGFRVVIYREDRSGSVSSVSPLVPQRPMEFGLFMWGNDDAAGSEKYRLLLEGAKYFDENGFHSVWTPERHFSAFGGPYPNPAVTSAALAVTTKNLAIRSGSIVSPLHHPLRIAEDWAVVDNLSDGRVGLSFAAGWQPNDFVIMPQNHSNNKQVMLDQLEMVRRLWRGEKVLFENPLGQQVEISTLPRPVQKELPVWLTTAGNPESYRLAGSLGANLLTHLLGQTVEEVAEKIRIYRQARQEAGFDAATGKVTLMLHTFVGRSDAEVREFVRQPMKDYLGSSMKLVLDFAWTFPAFKRPGGVETKPEDINIKHLTEEEVDTILDFAFERYYETSGLFGTPEQCQQMIDRCKAADVDEIACLLDFGVETDKIMQGLPLLKEVRDLANANEVSVQADTTLEDQSLPAQLERHGVTHFQCTPSMARMLAFDAEARRQMAKLKHVMIGGEAFPHALARDLKGFLQGRLTNMYGPTETTIWSTTHEVEDPDNIPIGRPIANTEIYILDENRQPVPVGVPGDLFIGGHGVVRGYLNRPELSKERFIPNPWKNDGSRIYWTGDLAKYREDGVIEFLGRIDHQVKIRGYRIELGEIEMALGLHPSLRESVVIVREDSPGDQRLVAYLVPKQKAPPVGELRDYLRQSLPEYMVPNDMVILERMPLTPNGKIDRRQLPLPFQTGTLQAAEYVAPSEGLQQIIASIWQDTLKVENISVKDNFFDLGGHSLLIVRVHQLLKAKIEKPISLTDLYRFPTIKSLTDFLTLDDVTASLQQSSDRASRRRERLGLRRRNTT